MTKCTNLRPGFSCETCPDGYEEHLSHEVEFNYQHQQCYDINECDTEICDINSDCTNTDGSYHCSCKRGYEILNEACKLISGWCFKNEDCPIGTRCVEINQCESG